MQKLRQVVLDYVGGELRKNLTFIPGVPIVDEKKRHSLYIQKINYLQSSPVYFLKSLGDIKRLWESIRSDTEIYELVTGGAYSLELFGWSGAAERNLRIKHVAAAAGWISNSLGIDEATKDAAYSNERLSNAESVFHSDPWLVFIAILQTIDSTMLLNYSNATTYKDIKDDSSETA